MTDSFDMELGAWLESKRAEKGLTQADIARRMGVTRTAVHCWEKGKRKLYADVLLEYCEACGINLQDFIDERRR